MFIWSYLLHHWYITATEYCPFTHIHPSSIIHCSRLSNVALHLAMSSNSSRGILTCSQARWNIWSHPFITTQQWFYSELLTLALKVSDDTLRKKLISATISFTGHYPATPICLLMECVPSYPHSWTKHWGNLTPFHSPPGRVNPLFLVQYHRSSQVHNLKIQLDMLLFITLSSWVMQ